MTSELLDRCSVYRSAALDDPVDRTLAAHGSQIDTIAGICQPDEPDIIRQKRQLINFRHPLQEHHDAVRLGYQIPNFTYPGVAERDIFTNVVEQAKAAETAGFDRNIFLMDHFYQLPGIGAPDEPMLECYTMLSALAQHTEKVRLSALVTGNTYRNPALLAKTVTALDHVSLWRPCDARHRRRLVRTRARLARLRVRDLHRSFREA